VLLGQTRPQGIEGGPACFPRQTFCSTPLIRLVGTDQIAISSRAPEPPKLPKSLSERLTRTRTISRAGSKPRSRGCQYICADVKRGRNRVRCWNAHQASFMKSLHRSLAIYGSIGLPVFQWLLCGRDEMLETCTRSVLAAEGGKRGP